MIDFSGSRVHFIGIGGISMSALAMILKNKGALVTGSDLSSSKIIHKLQQNGIAVFCGHSPDYVKDANMIVYSPAIHDNNPELIEAKKRGLFIICRAELLSIIASEYDNIIAVAGSHGKTTTTAMIASCFLEDNRNPTIHIGGEMCAIDGNVRIGEKNYFITEACEYVDSFLKLKNQMVSCALNVQADHMDYFKTIKNLQKSFKKYIKNTNKNGFCVINADDSFLKSVNIYAHRVTYAINNQDADFTAKNVEEGEYSRYSFDVYYKNNKLKSIKLSVTGRHQIYNALASFAVCKCFGISDEIIGRGLENFNGVKRRFEDVGYINKAKVFHDYAHHPTEIAENIKATKKFTNGKLYVVFQPHTYSRTQALWNEFMWCFDGADEVVVFKIYPARENKIDGITAESLAESIEKTKLCASACNEYGELWEILKSKVMKDDIVLILGAGDIERFCEYMKSQNEES